jgi:hypothetical protein
MQYSEEEDLDIVDFKELQRQMKAEMKKSLKKIQKEVKNINCMELYNQLQVSPCKIRIYDTRPKEEFQKYSLPYSVNLPESKIDELSILLPVLSDPTDEFVVIVGDPTSKFHSIVADCLSHLNFEAKFVYLLSDHSSKMFDMYPFMLHQQSSFIPFPSEIVSNWLFCGGAYNGYTLEQIEVSGFQCIINASGHQRVDYPKSIKVVNFDGTLKSFRECEEFLRSCEIASYKTLVFSGLGQHRSPAIIIFYLQNAKKYTFDEAFDLVAKARPAVMGSKREILDILTSLE